VPNDGTVYAVAGASGQISGGSLNHPAMFVSLNVLGSMVLDIDGSRLAAQYLDNNGTRRDYFTILKGGTGNVPPTVSINSPASGATFSAPATVTLQASAADSDGSVSRVDFYANGTLLGGDTSSPYGFAWSAPVGSPDDEQRNVRVTDALGQVVEGVPERKAEASLVDHVAQFAGDGIGEGLGGDRHRRHEAMTGLERRAHQVEGLGKLLAEEIEPLAAKARDDGHGNQAEEEGRQDRHEPVATDDAHREQADQREKGNVENDLAGAAAQPRLAYHPYEREDGGETQQNAVEPGNGRQALVAQQGDAGGV
jgi:hypothetical protein